MHPSLADESDAHLRLHKDVIAAANLLRQRDRGALRRDRPGHHVKNVVHARGLEIVDLHRAHHEGKPRDLGLRFRKQRMLFGAHQPQMIGAPAFHEAQVIGVIEDAGKSWLDVIATQKRRDFLGPMARGGLKLLGR